MKKYSSYKDSGVKWLGEIPSHWKVLHLRNLIRIFSEKGFPNAQLLSVTREKGVILRNKDDKEENHNFVPDDLSGYKHLLPGDFIINKMKSWQGSYGVSPYEGIVSPAYYTCKLKGVDKDFFSKAIRSKAYIPFFSQFSKGIRVDQWDLDPSAMKNIPFVLPSIKEQRAIASYISQITEHIDQAIAQQQKMIDLLNERKQIIIQNAVTKGLDPNVEMKDSGMDWIEKIPSTWKRIPLRYICKFGKGLQITKADLVEEGLPVVSYGQVHAKYNTRTHLSQELIRFVPYSYAKDNENCLVHPREFIVADTSEDFNGCGNMVYNDSSKNIYAGYHTVILRDINFENPKYLAYLFASELWRYQVRKRVNGIKVYSITKGILSQVDVIKPSVEEQDNIVKYLDGQTYTIDKNIELIGKRISILQERKQIIINDVVTGKVKVC